MAKITITLEDKDDGPMITLSPPAADIRRIRDEALPGLPSPATTYALVAITAIGNMSKNADKAEARLRGIILP